MLLYILFYVCKKFACFTITPWIIFIVDDKHLLLSTNFLVCRNHLCANYLIIHIYLQDNQSFASVDNQDNWEAI